MPENDDHDTTAGTDTPLWRFALALWQQDAARDLCLQLQEQGWSVTRLLCAGWMARQGRHYSGNEPESLQQWRRNVTESIRHLKKSLGKSDSLLAPLRESLARAELEAERIELYRAWQTLRDTAPGDTTRPGPSITESNLRQAAPATNGSINGMTEPMIRQLAQLIGTVSSGHSHPSGSQGA